MPNRSALEAMRAELRRKGLPRANIARLLQEWDDHLQDLVTEQGGTLTMEALQQARVRLGHPELLLAAAVAHHQRTNFFGRHPVWTFVLAPIPLVTLCWLAFVLIGFGLGALAVPTLGSAYQLEGKTVSEWPTPALWAVQAFHQACRFVPPAFATLLLCWLARRSGLRLRWMMTACVLVALTAGCFYSQLFLPQAPGGGKFMIGFGLPMLSVPGLLQLAVPLCVGLAFIWFSHRAKAKLATTPE